MTISKTGLVIIVFAVLGLMLNACNQNQPAAPPPPKVTVSKPVVKNIVEWDEYTGRLEAVDTVDVRARVSGYLESIHFKDGQTVKAGDLLFVIDPRPYQAELDRAEAELRLAQARLSLAENDLKRAQHLVSARAISEEEADTKASDEQVARATVEQAFRSTRSTATSRPTSSPISDTPTSSRRASCPTRDRRRTPPTWSSRTRRDTRTKATWTS